MQSAKEEDCDEENPVESVEGFEESAEELEENPRDHEEGHGTHHGKSSPD